MTSNSIELRSPEYSALAVPSATPSVFIDGAICEELAVLEIIRGSWPDFGSAKLTFQPTSKASTVETLRDRFYAGQTVRLQQLLNTRPPWTGVSGLTVFSGRVEAVEITVDEKGEQIEIIARDFSAVLERITVYGRRVCQSDGRSAVVAGLDTTFNPSGEGNASTERLNVQGKSYTAFAAGAMNGRAWSCAEVIDYLLCEYLPPGHLTTPTVGQLEVLTDHQLVRDLDVTGLSLLEALHRCCQGAGLAFRFIPAVIPGGPSEAIVFYRNGRGRAVELNMQPCGEGLNLSRTNCATLHSRRNRYPVTHRYIGQGDFKVYEATFELVPAWDPALEDDDPALFSPVMNPQFHQVKDVYRKWCLNEAGDYTAAPYDRGEPYDLSVIFEGADYVQQRRRFWPALTADAQGRSLGYRLEMSNDSGLSWWEYLYSFDNLLEECGIWLSGDQFDIDVWVAALRGTLRFRITASIVSDERLTAIVADGSVGSTAPVVDHLITLPRQFHYRKVSARSIFASSVASGRSAADQIDDSAALFDCVRRSAAASAPAFEMTEVMTPTLSLHYQPGDRVTSSPDSRDLLACRRDVRSRLWIEQVRMDFARQCTELNIARRRF